jgi:alpha-ketoglutarate-dependent 2,4-dichlorophenoxyacetate dioxygenase
LTRPAGEEIFAGADERGYRVIIEIRQVNPLFVAAIGGIDLGEPVDRTAVGLIWQAIDRYAVLVFHDQHLDNTQLRNFASNFGALEIGRAVARPGRRRLAHPEIGDISNLDEDGRLRERDDRRRLDSLGNRLWHTDASYMPVPVVLGMLYAVAVPPANAMGGGETEFADMRAAYDALPAAMKAAIDGLVAEHDVFRSRGQIGFSELPPRRARAIPAVSAAAGAPSSRLAAQDALSLRRTPRTSSAGPSPRGVCCFTTSTCTRPSRNSSTATNGRSAIS